MSLIIVPEILELIRDLGKRIKSAKRTAEVAPNVDSNMEPADRAVFLQLSMQWLV